MCEGGLWGAGSSRVGTRKGGTPPRVTGEDLESSAPSLGVQRLWLCPGGVLSPEWTPCSLFLEDPLLRKCSSHGAAPAVPHTRACRSLLVSPVSWYRSELAFVICLTAKGHPHPASCSCVTEQAAGGAPSPPCCLERSYPHHTPMFPPPALPEVTQPCKAKGVSGWSGARLRQRNWWVLVSGSAHLTLWPLSHRPKRTSPAQSRLPPHDASL